METTPAFAGLECIECGEWADPDATAGPCPECGGILDPAYDYTAIDLSRTRLGERPFDGMWRYDDLLPFPRDVAVTLDEGATPLVECPRLAEEFGVRAVYIKDEGRNPTGSFKDRGQAVAVTAASQHGATDVALATAGNAGQAAAAYAARAGLDAHVFAPSRAAFVNTATTTVHGAELEVVDGRIGDAATAYEEAMADADWHSVQTFVTPYRHEGKKTMLYEIVEQLDWAVPDQIVYPTGGGVGLIGMHKGVTELRDLGLIEALPGLYAAQSTGCAPIVDALEAGADSHEPWAQPDTICGGIEIPDPGASPWILESLRESGGGAVRTADDEILDSAVTVARTEGLEMSVTGAAAASGAAALARQGEFEADDIVVLLNTATGNKDADVARSHAMGPDP